MEKNKHTGIFISLFVLSICFARAQPNRYVVFLKDKSGSTFSVSQPLQFLSEAAINRRIKNNIPVTESDLPVSKIYVDQINNTGAFVLYRTKWMNAVLVQCDASLLATIQALPFVSAIEFVAPGSVKQGKTQRNIYNFRQTFGNKTETQLSILGLDAMHAAGIHGENIKVAVFDSGFPGVNTTAPFAHIQDNILDTYNFVNNKTNVYLNDSHGTEVLSTMAAYIEGSFTGGIYNADYYLYQTEDASSEYRIEEYNWLFAAERADSTGVDVINASLGYNTFDNASMNYSKTELNGSTAVVTRAAQFASDRGIFVVVSAGNEGSNSWLLVTPPADAAGVIATGSVTSTKTRSTFSSIGPTTDNRIKPDVSAMGSGVFVVRENGSIGTTSGTSVASPLMASLTAGLVQQFPLLSKETIVDAIKKSASQADNPNNYLGYGIPHFNAAVNYLSKPNQTELFAIFPNPTTNGEVYVRYKEPQTSSPMRIELLNIQGVLLKQQLFIPDWLNTKATIYLNDLPSGLLLIRVTTDEQSEVFKIINIL